MVSPPHNTQIAQEDNDNETWWPGKGGSKEIKLHPRRQARMVVGEILQDTL